MYITNSNGIRTNTNHPKQTQYKNTNQNTMNSIREERRAAIEAKTKKFIPPMENRGVFMKNMANFKWKDRM